MVRAIVLYDRDCGFCRWTAAKLLAWDRGRRLRAVALQDPEADRLPSRLDADRRLASWHLVTADMRAHSAGRAVPPLLRLLPGGTPLAAVADALPRSTDRLYEWVSSHRRGLGELLGVRRCEVDPSKG